MKSFIRKTAAVAGLVSLLGINLLPAQSYATQAQNTSKAPVSSSESIDGRIGEIDLQHADNGELHLANEWIALYNSQKGEFKGKRMFSAPDFYRLMSAPNEIRKSIVNNWIIALPIIIYDSKGGARIIHNYKSAIPGVKPVEIALTEVPVYSKESIITIVQTDLGLSYIKALFQTQDTPVQIINKLEKITGKNAKDILFRTTNQENRKVYSKRAVLFGDIDDGFHVDGDSSFDGKDYGLSRGVRVNSKRNKPLVIPVRYVPR